MCRYSITERIENAEEIFIGLGVFWVFWYIAIIGYIFRQLLKFHTAASLVLAFCYFVLTYGIPMLFMDI